jgi:hypothetical protein
MGHGVRMRQALIRGENRRAASVLSWLEEFDQGASGRSRLGVHLTDVSLGRSGDVPYVYYRGEPDRDGGFAGRYRALVDAAVEESDVFAAAIRAFDRLTDGAFVSAEFRADRPVRETDTDIAARHGSPCAEDRED